LAGTDTVAIDAGDVTLPASGNVSIIANLDAGGNPALNVFTNDTSGGRRDRGRRWAAHWRIDTAWSLTKSVEPLPVPQVDGSERPQVPRRRRERCEGDRRGGLTGRRRQRAARGGATKPASSVAGDE
jgi:hypothetical protein